MLESRNGGKVFSLIQLEDRNTWMLHGADHIYITYMYALITHSIVAHAYNTLLGHPVVGGSWEGFVIENIMAVIPSRVQPYYYSTSRGEEIDLVLECQWQ